MKIPIEMEAKHWARLILALLFIAVVIAACLGHVWAQTIVLFVVSMLIFIGLCVLVVIAYQ